MTRWFRRRGDVIKTAGPCSPAVYAPNSSNTNIHVNANGPAKEPSRPPPAQEAGGFVQKLAPGYFERNPLAEGFRDFLKKRDRGYFAVEADPGMGKSAFAAWVKDRHGCPAHFLQAGSDAGRADVVVRSLCSQLIARWKILDPESGGPLSCDGRDPAWLGWVIERAAALRDAREKRRWGRPRRPLIIVVDALNALDPVDEHPAQGLPFGLPQHLPRGVYVVLTTRKGHLRNTPHDQTRLVALNAHDSANREALGGLLRARATQDARVAQALHTHGVGAADFVNSALSHSSGSWVYAHYLIESIAENPHLVTDLPALPHGLDGFYQRAVLPLVRDSPDQDERIALLAALGAAREPLDAPGLCALAGVADITVLERLMKDGLRPFCDVVRPDGDTSSVPPLYSPHHPSFQEYLSGTPTDADPQADRALRHRIRRGCHQAHEQACDRYLSAWGGLDSGLPTLRSQPELADLDEGYGRRHLVSHLLAAGRDSDVHRLLSLSADDTHLWYAAHRRTQDIDGFLRDVDRAARSAEDSPPTHLGYQLIEASIASMVTASPPRMIGELLWRGIWTPVQAFQRIARITDSGQQAQALVPLLPKLPEELLPHALALASAYRDSDRAPVLTTIIPLLDPTDLDHAIELTLGRDHALPLPGPLLALVERLLPQPGDALQRLPDRLGVSTNRERAYVDAALAMFRTRDRTAGARSALKRIGQLGLVGEDAELVAALLPHVPAPVYGDVIASLDDLDTEYCEPLMSALGAHTPVDWLPALFGALASGPYRPALAVDTLQDALPHLVMQVRDHGSSWSALLLSLAMRDDLPSREIPAVLDLAARLPGHASLASTAELMRVLVQQLHHEEVRKRLDALSASTRLTERLDTGTRHALLGALLGRLPAAEAQEFAHAELTTVAQSEFPHRWESLAYVARYASPADRLPLLDHLSSNLWYGWEQPHADPHLALSLLAPHLDQREVDHVLDKVGAHDAWHADGAVTAHDALAPALSDQALSAAADNVAAHRLDAACFRAFAALGQRQEPEARARTARRALDLIGGTQHHESRAEAVRALAPVLSPSDAVKALELLEPVHNPEWKVPAIDALGTRLPSEWLSRALTCALRTVGQSPWAIRQLPALLSRCAEVGEVAAVDPLVTQMSQLGRDEPKDLVSLMPYLSSRQTQQAWDAVTDRPPSLARTEALAALHPRLPAHERPRREHLILTALADRDDSAAFPGRATEAEARALGHLLRAGPTDAGDESLRCFLRSREAHNFPLHRLLTALDTPIPDAVTETALECALAEDWWDFRLRALRVLAPSLSPGQAARAAHTVSAARLGPDTDSAAALTALGTRLEGKHRRTVLDEAFRHTYASPMPLTLTLHGDTLRALLDELPPPQRDALVRSVIRCVSPSYSTWRHDSDLTTALSSLGLARHELEELYTAVSTAQSPSARAQAQACVLRQLGADWDTSAFRGKSGLHLGWPRGIARDGLSGLIAASAWWLRREGGAEAVDDVANALLDVCARWP
ncbi:hypothetical protein [Streptomyces alboflavus]|uniref:hypothetical protein n=1 Tax=Streptomyces alboflavus TaxID=67267 RepID=UPI0036752A1D